MASQGDRYTLLFEQPMVNATGYWPQITDYIISLGIPQHSTILTGWGQEDGQRKTLLLVSITVPKNSYTDAQIIAIGQQIASILGKPIHTVEHQTIDVLFP